MKKVIIGGSTTNSILSKIIGWFERMFPRSKSFRKMASHSFVAYYNEDLEQVMVQEASWFGYRTTAWNKWSRGRILTQVFHNASKDMAPSVRFMAQRLGADYDYTGLLGFIWMLIVHRILKKWIRHPFQNPRKFHCSEAAIMLVQHAGYLDDLKDTERVYPEQLHQRLANESDFQDVTEKVASGQWWKEFKKEDAR